VNLHHEFEVRDFHLGEALVAQDARIVDDDVEVAEFLDDDVDEIELE
jgi:hypothetical protein